MTTENVRIMREIHNEQRELESSVDGYTLFHHLKDVEFLNETTKKLLWRSSELKRTFFGLGFLDETQDYEDDEELHEMYDLLIRSFLLAGLNYQNTEYSEQRPFEVLTDQIGYVFTEIAGFDFPEDRVISLLAELIECETLAAWLHVSWLN